MKTSAIVVTGGAGYIGSHIVHALASKGYCVIVIDHKPKPAYLMPLLSQAQGEYVCADYADAGAWKVLADQYSIEAVMHCAAFIDVGQSVRMPDIYYDNNVAKTIGLLNILKKYDIKRLIFSSSCAVYGNPEYTPLDENHTTAPLSPYATSKLMVEWMLKDYAHAHGFSVIALRYFNAAGALYQEDLGERHEPETHIIPLLIKAALEKKPFCIFGTDYSTPDGTCIRDYIHVVDLAQAHVQALEYLLASKTAIQLIANVGTGSGYTVREIITTVQEIIGIDIALHEVQRRPGDSPVLCANPDSIERIIGWRAQLSLSDMIVSSYHFYTKSCSMPPICASLTTSSGKSY